MDRFGKNYTPITDEQKALGLAIKEKAEELEALIIQGRRSLHAATATSRRDGDNVAIERAVEANDCSNQALARLEECVMWACKGVYTELPQSAGGNS